MFDVCDCTPISPPGLVMRLIQGPLLYNRNIRLGDLVDLLRAPQMVSADGSRSTEAVNQRKEWMALLINGSASRLVWQDGLELDLEPLPAPHHMESHFKSCQLGLRRPPQSSPSSVRGRASQPAACLPASGRHRSLVLTLSPPGTTAHVTSRVYWLNILNF